MGSVAVLHPQAYLKENPVNSLPAAMKSRRMIKFNPDYTNPPSRNPNFSVHDGWRRSPAKGILKKKEINTPAVVTDSPAAVASKKLVMGQVKILKRGEALNESSTVLKEVNDRKVSNDAASTPSEVSQLSISGRRVLPAKKKKKKAEKDQNMISNSSLKVVQASKVEDVALSSTDRLGPDPELVSKQMTEFFAGSAFADSPPPSSVPLPGFLQRNLLQR